MAIQQMTSEEYRAKFGQTPIVSGMTQSTTMTKTPTITQPVKSVQPKKKLLEQGGAVQQIGTGIAKGAIQTVQGLGQLGLKGVKALTGKDLGTEETFFQDPNALQPTTTGEKIGKFGEQVAEFAIPGGAVAQSTKALPFLAKVGARAATSGAVATAQQGEVGKETAMAAGVEAAIPVAGKIIRPAVKFMGTLLKGTGSGLSGAPSEAIESIYKEGQAAIQTAKEIKKSGGAQILRKNAEKVINGISKIKQEARKSFGQGLEGLAKTDIDQGVFSQNISPVAQRYGFNKDIISGKYSLTNIEFTDPKNVKKATELLSKMSNTDLDGKSLRRLMDDIDNSKYKTAMSDERLSFNAFLNDLSGSIKKAVSASTSKLNEINKAYSSDIQLAEAAEKVFGKVKYKNLGEVMNAAQRLEGLFTEKGLAPEVIDDFLERIGVSSSNFKSTEAMRQLTEKSFTANTVGTSPFEVLRAFTSAVVSPKMVGQIAARLGIAENVVKEMSEKLSPTTRGAIIKLLTGNQE